jgi:hypothetical protein
MTAGPYVWSGFWGLNRREAMARVGYRGKMKKLMLVNRLTRVVCVVCFLKCGTH